MHYPRALDLVRPGSPTFMDGVREDWNSNGRFSYDCNRSRCREYIKKRLVEVLSIYTDAISYEERKYERIHYE